MLTGIFKKQVPKHPINPRFRAYGKARLDIARRAASGSDWDKLWKEPAFPFPFDWGEWWKQCIEYKVDDFPAEVGFYTDILGLPVVAFDPNYAMFTSPSEDFFLAVVPALEPGKSTPPDALRIQFMVAEIFETVRELERRGIVFEQKPQPCERGSSLFITYFRTPHGLSVDLWGVVTTEEQRRARPVREEEDFDVRGERVRGERVQDERVHPERPVSSSPAHERSYREEERAEPEDLFTDDEEEDGFERGTGLHFFADGEEEGEADHSAGLRFFVEPAIDIIEPGEEGETGTPEELNFGAAEPEAAVKKKRTFRAGEVEEEEVLEDGDEEFDEEDDSEGDDSFPYEYVYVDDL